MRSPRCLTTLAAAFLAATMPLVATANLAIENVTFHRSTNLGYDGSSPTDNGGGLFVQVRNTGAVPLGLTAENLQINGTPITTIMTQGPGAPTPGWVRVWPESIAPGEAATWVVKTFGGTVTEGAVLASIQATADGGATATVSNVTLVTPKLRLAHVVPSHDGLTTWVFLRNDDTTAITVDELVLNSTVTGATTFLGGPTVAPGGLLIAQVAHAAPVPLLTPLSIRASGLRAADSARVTVGSFIRLTEPEYGLTTWGSSPSNDEARVQRLRQLYGLTGNSWGGVSPILAAKSQRYFYRQRMLDILAMTNTETVDMTNSPIVTALAGTGQVGAWFVEDEPDLSYSSATRNPRALANLSRAYWRLDPGTPTHVNLVSSRSAQAYALAVDHPAIDAYMQYAPRHYGNIVSQTYPIDEALEQTENLKRVAEPIRVWMTPQGVSPGTWGTQPTDWGIAIQFWAQVMGGAKGLDGFKFDDTATNAADPGGVRTQRQINLIRQLRLVEGVLVYGDPIANVTTNKPAADLAARAIVGASSVVVPVVNLAASHTRTLGSWGTPTKTDQTNVNISIPVPTWINVARVVEVTPAGLVPIAHTVSGGTVQINGLNVADARVFLLGSDDTTPPAAPTGLQSVPDLNNLGGTLLSWRQPFDETGLLGYRVYRDGAEIASVRTPIAAITPPAPGECPAVYTVRAEDGAGNLGPASAPLVISAPNPLDTRFEEPGNSEGWVALNDISSAVVADGVLDLQVFDGPGAPNGSIDAYIVNAGLSTPAAAVDTLWIRLQNETPNTALEFFWETEFGGWAGPGSNGGNRLASLPITGNDTALRDYFFDLSALPAWEGTPRNFRIDPANGAVPGRVRIDRISFLASANYSPAWRFTRDGDREGWGDPATSNQIAAIAVSGGELQLQVTAGGDPFITSPPLRAGAGLNRYVIIRMQNTTSATNAELYWTSTASPGFDGTKRVGFTIAPNATAMQDIVLDMQGAPGWSGTIDRLRLDPTAGGPAGLVRIDSIRLAASTTPNAAPTITVPLTIPTVPQGQSIVLPPAVLCDSEAGDDDIQLTIFTAQGTVAVGALGATRIAAGANHSPSITLHGSLRAIVAAVQSGITYTADPAFAGNATIVYTVDDLGSGAPGGRLTATANQSVTVTGTHTSVQAWAILGE